MTPPILDSRDFYDRQAAIYEVMNDWPARLSFELPFIRRALEQARAKSVLDVACGSGHHAIELAREGYEAHGADISAEMIAQARLNAERANVSVRFEQAGFADVAQFAPQVFDAILCLGNSLPHALTEDDQLTALAAMHERLRPGGTLILQNLNYDLRWKNRPRFFALRLAAATVDGRPLLIWRMADYHDPGTRVPGLTAPCPEPGLITFHIATFEQDAAGTWQVSVKSTLQRPLFASDLRRWLVQAGFKDVMLFGGMDGSEFDPESSPDLVIMARKPSNVKRET